MRWVPHAATSKMREEGFPRQAVSTLDLYGHLRAEGIRGPDSIIFPAFASSRARRGVPANRRVASRTVCTGFEQSVLGDGISK